MMIDVLTEMCAIGGCAAHYAITDECRHCENYQSEIERRKALLLEDGSDGLKSACVPQGARTRAVKGDRYESET